MKPAELKELWQNSDSDSATRHQVLFAEDYFDGWEVADPDDWTQDHKYQYIARVIKHTETGRCFCINAGRSGSYHTDWYYNYDDLTEVKEVKKVVTVTTWEAV